MFFILILDIRRPAKISFPSNSGVVYTSSTVYILGSKLHEHGY